jgi:hypothetical protein
MTTTRTKIPARIITISNHNGTSSSADVPDEEESEVAVGANVTASVIGFETFADMDTFVVFVFVGSGMTVGSHVIDHCIESDGAVVC